jgi:transglutaminase-like putative cysteine protease
MSSGVRLREGWTFLILLTVLSLTIAWGINAARWADGLGILQWTVLGAIVIGLMCARSILPGFVAGSFSLVIGAAWSLWLAGTLLPSSYTWGEKWINMMSRFSGWFYKAIRGGTSSDNLVFIMEMSLLSWCVAYLSIWFVFRSGKIWHAVIPGGVVLLVNLYYAPNDLTFFFIVYLVFSLLLIVRFNLHVQQQAWRAADVAYSSDIGFDFLRGGVIFIVLVIAFAWLMPTAVVSADSLSVLRGFGSRWQQVQREWNRLFSGLHYRARANTVDTFGKTMDLRGPVNLPDVPVMDVQASDGRYWRAVVYDEYNGSGWTDNSAAVIAFPGGAGTPSPARYELRRPITQTFTIFQAGTTVLLAASQVRWVSLPAQADAFLFAGPGTPPGGGSSQVAEISMLRSLTHLVGGESYSAVSDISYASVEVLRRAGTDYPPWVRQRYLQLPASLPARVREKAQEITAAADNPYDKADALEKYLRTAITYNEQIPQPPADRDRVDYFLFDSRQGYCDYYASAMVVMARSVGIPARLASGYAHGEYSPTANVYHVRGTDAHAWVEVFFPRYGWIEFEPTTARPPIERPVDEDAQMPEADYMRAEQRLPGVEQMAPPALVGAEPAGWMSWWSRVPTVAFGLAPLLVLGAAFWAWRWRTLREVSTAEAIYGAMVRYARWLEVQQSASLTPYEYTARLRSALERGHEQINLIADGYVRERFSGKPTGQSELARLNEAWQYLRGILWRSVLRYWAKPRRWQRFLRRPRL